MGYRNHFTRVASAFETYAQTAFSIFSFFPLSLPLFPPQGTKKKNLLNDWSKVLALAVENGKKQMTNVWVSTQDQDDYWWKRRKFRECSSTNEGLVRSLRGGQKNTPREDGVSTVWKPSSELVTSLPRRRHPQDGLLSAVSASVWFESHCYLLEKGISYHAVSSYSSLFFSFSLFLFSLLSCSLCCRCGCSRVLCSQ